MKELDKLRNELLLQEARRKYDKIDRTFNGMRSRMLVFLSVELAILTYLFSDLQSLYPQELYGRIFFFFACACVVVSVGLLFYRYRTISNWPVPVGPLEVEKMKNAKDENEVYKIVLEDHELASTEANNIVGKHAKTFNFSLISFVIGAIILLVIKFF